MSVHLSPPQTPLSSHLASDAAAAPKMLNCKCELLRSAVTALFIISSALLLPEVQPVYAYLL